MTDDPFAHIDAGTAQPDPFAHLDAMAAQRQAQGETGNWSSRLGRLAQGAAEPLIGAAQLASHITGVGTSYMDRKAQEAEDFYQKSRQAAGYAPQDTDWWRVAGNVASPINFVPGAAIGRLGEAATLAGRVGQGALAGAVGSAVQPVSNITPANDYGAQKEAQLIAGGLTGGALGPAASAIGRGLIPEVAPEARALAGEGVRLTSGQMAGPGSWIKRLEDVGEKAPFIGGQIREAREQALTDFNRTAFNRALEPVGEKLPAEAIGHEAFNAAEDILSKKYSDIHPKLTLSRTTDFDNDLKNLFDEHAIDLVEPRQKQLMNFINKKITDRIDARGGVLEGEDIQKITSELAHQARKWAKATDPDQLALGEAFRDVRLAVNQALADQNPALAPELQSINAAWARLMTLQPAVASTASAARHGVFTPTQLETAVNQAASKRQMARGKAWGQDLAEAGKRLLPANIASSGTAERGATMDAISAILHGAVSPTTLLGMAAAPVLYSNPGQDLARRLMLGSTPQQVQYVNRLLSQYGPAIAGAGAGAMNQ